MSHVSHKQVTSCHVTCQSQASHRLTCHMSVTSKSQVVMSHVSHKQVTGCHVTCPSQASHRLTCHMSITSKSQVDMSHVSHKQVTGCQNSLAASHPNGSQAQLLDNLKPLMSRLGYHHSQEQPSLQAFPWEQNYVHAKCYITCTMSRHMHDVTSHACCHVTCTLSHHMHVVTSHARCHVTCTMSRHMHVVMSQAHFQLLHKLTDFPASLGMKDDAHIWQCGCGLEHPMIAPLFSNICTHR